MKEKSPISYWKDSAADALDTSEKIYANAKYHHALFFLHLAIEKILKAVYVFKIGESPLPLHDLVRLAERAGVQLEETQKLELAEISTFNVAARYDDYKLQFYKKATKNYASQWMEKGKRLYRSFVSLLP